MVEIGISKNMTKKLEDLLNIEPADPVIESKSVDVSPIPTINLQDKLEEFNKISAALPTPLDKLPALLRLAYMSLNLLPSTVTQPLVAPVGRLVKSHEIATHSKPV